MHLQVVAVCVTTKYVGKDDCIKLYLEGVFEFLDLHLANLQYFEKLIYIQINSVASKSLRLIIFEYRIR